MLVSSLYYNNHDEKKENLDTLEKLISSNIKKEIKINSHIKDQYEYYKKEQEILNRVKGAGKKLSL